MLNQQNNFNFSLGAKRDPKDNRDFRIAGITKVVDVPKQIFSLSEIFPAKNQHTRPSCTSNAQAHHKERQEERKSSARFVMGLTKQLEGNIEEGAYTRDTFYIVSNCGICSEELYPEPRPEMSWEEYIDVSKIPQQCYDDAKEHKSQSYWRVNNTIDELRLVLTQHKNSVVCSMEWFKEFNSPVNGRLPESFSNSVGGHAVECTSFDDFKEELKFKNSWNGWGIDGFFYMPYNIFNKVVWDLWTSKDLPKEMPVDSYYGEKRTWTSYMREKSFAFNPWIFKKIGRLPTAREIRGLAYGFWSADAIFSGKVKDTWLKITKPEAIKNGVVDKSENLIK